MQQQITVIPTEIIIAVTTFISSVGASMFVAGTRWGQINTEMRTMNDRLAKIEGMFTLTPKDMHQRGD